MKKIYFILVFLIILITMSCQPQQRPIRLRIGHTNFAYDQAVAFVLKGILDQQPNLVVELYTAPDSLLFRFLADDELDIVISGWLPNTHGRFIEKHAQDIRRLGVLNDSLGIFIAVPDYLPIDYIYELPEVATELMNTIFVPDSRNAVFGLTQGLLKDYKLTGFELVELPWDNIIGMIEEHQENQWGFAFITPRPHYSFARHNLRALIATERTFGNFEKAHMIINNMLPERLPQIANFLSRVSFSLNDIEYIMDMNQVIASDPYENAMIWISENTFRINRWLIGR